MNDFVGLLRLPDSLKDDFDDYISSHNVYDRDSGELAELPEAEIQRLYTNWINELKDKKRAFFIPISNNDNDIEKGIRQLFGMPGGKRRLAQVLAKFVEEQEHKIYIECMAGGAAVFFAKSPSEKEVLADINEDRIFAYKFVQDITDEQIAKLKKKKWDADEDYFYKLRDKERPKDPAERFYWWMYIAKFSYGDKGGHIRSKVTFDTGHSGIHSDVIDSLPRIKERLQNVIIERADYRETIKKYDNKDSLTYLDPPYSGEEVDGTKIDNLEFYEAVKKIKGKWLVSLNDLPENREAFKDYNICTVYIGRRFDSGGEKGATRDKELLIANFELPEKIIKIVGEKLETGESELTREEQRELLESEIGNWYLAIENDKKHRFVIQYHVRGIWSSDFVKQLKSATEKLKAGKIPDDVDELIEKSYASLDDARLAAEGNLNRFIREQREEFFESSPEYDELRKRRDDWHKRYESGESPTYDELDEIEKEIESAVETIKVDETNSELIFRCSIFDNLNQKCRYIEVEKTKIVPQAKFNALWKANDMAYLRTSLDELSKEAQKVDDDRGNVSSIVKKHLIDETPKIGEFDLDKVYNLGNVHADWRNEEPDGSYLIGMTNDTVKIVLQDLNDELHFILRDRILQNQDGDNWLSQKKAAQPCFHPNSLIFTNRGFIEAGKVSINDKILNSTNSFDEILKLESQFAFGDFYRVKISGLLNDANPIVTGDHPFLVIESQNCESHGDYNCRPDGGFWECGERCKNPLFLDYEIKWKRAEDLNSEGDYVLFSNSPILKIGEQGSYEKGYVLGTLLGDGSAVYESDYGRSALNRISVFFNAKETEKIDKFKKALKSEYANVNFETQIRHEGNMIVLRFSIAELADEFREFYSMSSVKEFELEKFQNCSYQYLHGVFDGLIASDGYIDKSGVKHLVNTSPSLAALHYAIIQSLNLGIPNVRYRENTNSDLVKSTKLRKIFEISCTENVRSFDLHGFKCFKINEIEKVENPKRLINIVPLNHIVNIPNAITHNTAWLTLVDNKRKVWEAEPERVGATRYTSGRIIFKASGRVVWGVRKTDYGESFHFFDQDEYKHLNGRFDWKLIPSRKEYTKAPEKAFWMGSRPWKTQTPYILTHDREEEEAKAKKDKIEMVWNDKTIDVLRELKYEHLDEIEKIARIEFEMPIIKVLADKQIAIGPLLVPNRVDAQNDFATPEDIEDAAHRCLEFGPEIKLMHDGKPIDAVAVESAIFRKYVDLPEGTWVGAVKIRDKTIWNKVKSGELRGFSIGGTGARQKVKIKR